jgi:tryptophan synthase alpha chain
MGPILDAFQRARNQNRIALIGYLPAGYPSPDDFLRIADTAFDAGLDVLEIGLPTGEAGMDGRVIRSALEKVMRSGLSVDRALDLGGQALRQGGRMGLAMVYASTIAEYGEAALLQRCADLNISGILPVGMSHACWQAFAGEACQRGVEAVGFLSADMPPADLQTTALKAGGFLYLQSSDGPTGRAVKLGPDVRLRIEQVRMLSGVEGLPVAVGFGIRSAADVARVRKLGADGAIVGTAFVEAAAKGAQSIRTLVEELHQATFF